jgi:hypothetical protein
MLSSYCIPTFTWIHAFQTGIRHSHSVGGGEGLNNQHEVGGEGGGGESTTMTMSKRGDAAQVNIGGKGDKGMTKVTITGG